MGTLRRRRRGLRPGVRSGGHRQRLLRPQALRLGQLSLRCLGSLPGLRQKSFQRCGLFANQPVDFRDALRLLLNLPTQAVGPVFLILQLPLHPVNVLPMVGGGGFQHGHGGFLLCRQRVLLPGLRSQTLGLHVLFPHPLAILLALGVQRVQLDPGLVPGDFGGAEVALQLSGPGLQRVQILEPGGNLQNSLLVPENQVLLRLFRLIPQRLHLQFKLRDFVVDAHQIFVRALKLAFRLLLAVAVFRDARGLLENLPAVAAFGGQNLIDFTLPDDGIPLPAHAGVQKQLRHVLEPDGLAVDIIFALPAAVVPPGDGHLGFLHGGENVPRVVQHQRHLRKSLLRPLGGAAKNHVLHLRAPQALHALLSHDPADGVGGIRFSGAVGPHNGGDVLAELQNRFVGKGFEALNFQCL
ncbi:hypothetical protein SDC9_86456 [bioreactor metagenome]|uniref:Uncharacterized protein n=1 Tax=bioreactor metagenome TaxID=1076179 RepID=A0A644ZG46_9ZZZZ